MDLEARNACLRAIQIVARSGRICAVTEPTAATYRAALDSSSRVIDRARSYYETATEGHASTERQVRQLHAALNEASVLAEMIVSPYPVDPDDLERQAEKVERAIARSEPPPAPVTQGA